MKERRERGREKQKYLGRRREVGKSGTKLICRAYKCARSCFYLLGL